MLFWAELFTSVGSHGWCDSKHSQKHLTETSANSQDASGTKENI